MRPVNIYVLTRVRDTTEQMLLERQISRRNHFLKIKEWEFEGLVKFVEQIMKVNSNSAILEFYYSFIMPKLGKEFDLLRISKDSIVNIELKSGSVSDLAIKKQLVLNKNYLSVLSKNVYLYTFISSENRLVRLSKNENLVEGDWEELYQELSEQKEVYNLDIEDVFTEDKYLISPLSDPDKFLRGEYFLTSQQKDIKKKILSQINNNKGFFGFCGLPGTGKTLLLYDIAMTLSKKDKVCVLHFGSSPEGLEQLDSRLKRLDFYGVEDEFIKIADIVSSEYKYILVDEGHMILETQLMQLLEVSSIYSIPIIVSRVDESLFKSKEIDFIKKNENYVEYQITNRIRINGEIAAFVKCLISPERYNQRKFFPSVDVIFSSNSNETEVMIDIYTKKGYSYVDILGDAHNDIICREEDKVVVVIDNSFCYDSSNRLKCSDDFNIKKMFHVLSRAKYNVAVIVDGNYLLFKKVISNIQKNEKFTK